jgi:hypothetical protein
MTTMPPPSWSTVLLSVLTQADLDLGYGPGWEPQRGTVERLPGDGDVARIDVGGLTRNRVVGLIEVDFGAQRLRLIAIDYYGGDEVEERPLPHDFWTEAKKVPWPILSR